MGHSQSCLGGGEGKVPWPARKLGLSSSQALRHQAMLNSAEEMRMEWRSWAGSSPGLGKMWGAPAGTTVIVLGLMAVAGLILGLLPAMARNTEAFCGKLDGGTLRQRPSLWQIPMKRVSPWFKTFIVMVENG